MLFAFAAMIGWCGTKWPGWWGPNGPFGPKTPQPDPWRIFGGVIGAIGGVGAIILFKDLIGDAGLVTTGAVAFFGGSFAADVVSGLTGMGNRAAVDVG